MARSKIGALKINGGAVAPANQGAALIQRVRATSQVKQFLTTKSHIKQEVGAR